LNPETKEDEDAFFKVEIVDFAKGMFGWGNLGIYAISLFVESLCDKAGLSDFAASLVKEVEAYCSLQTSEKKQAKAITVVAPSASHRRTVALSHAQIQEALGSQDQGAAFDIASDEFKSSSRRTAPRNQKTGAGSGKTDRTKSTSVVDSKNPAASIYAGPTRAPKGVADGKPPPPGKSAPVGPPKSRPASESAEFQLSRRKMAAKTVQLTSTGFLANLSMSGGSGFV